MNLGNPIEIVVHHLLIGGMAYLGYWDKFHMMSALVYVMYTKQDLQWIMMQNYQLSWFISIGVFIGSQAELSVSTRRSNA